MLNQIRIILVEPSHPGNIGAAARAMKNMGLSQLYLVAPAKDPYCGEAIARASGADDVLESAVVVHNMADALVDCERVYGTSARQRTLEKPLLDVREAAAEILAGPRSTVAILFGRESSGLTNAELSLCHQHIIIPTDEIFSSLNLAAAVQIISYELRQAAELTPPREPAEQRELATADQVLGFYQHLEQTLADIGFLDPKQPKMLMQRLQRLFNRCEIDTTEINILRGILSKVDQK